MHKSCWSDSPRINDGDAVCKRVAFKRQALSDPNVPQ
jgi:hypothetical protein